MSNRRLYWSKLPYALSYKAGVLIAAGQPEYRSSFPNYMKAHPNHTRISLERLKSEFTRSLIDTIFKQVERAPVTLAETINQRVEGNPLFVQEYLGMLFDNEVFLPKPEGGLALQYFDVGYRLKHDSQRSLRDFASPLG